MASKIKVTGKPKRMRRAELDGQRLICLDFVEGGRSLAPKGLPVPSKVSCTVLMNEKQFKKATGDSKASNVFYVIDGEVATDMPTWISESEFAVVAFKVEKVENR